MPQLVMQVHLFAIHLATQHTVLAAVVSAPPTPTAGGCASGDPLCAKFAQYAGWAPNWLQYLGIIGIVIGLLMGVIGHRRGWDHMREVVTAVIVAGVLITGASALFG